MHGDAGSLLVDAAAVHSTAMRCHDEADVCSWSKKRRRHRQVRHDTIRWTHDASYRLRRVQLAGSTVRTRYSLQARTEAPQWTVHSPPGRRGDPSCNCKARATTVRNIPKWIAASVRRGGNGRGDQLSSPQLST
jgi:hypothetical protein